MKVLCKRPRKEKRTSGLMNLLFSSFPTPQTNPTTLPQQAWRLSIYCCYHSEEQWAFKQVNKLHDTSIKIALLALTAQTEFHAGHCDWGLLSIIMRSIFLQCHLEGSYTETCQPLPGLPIYNPTLPSSSIQEQQLDGDALYVLRGLTASDNSHC